MRFTTPAIVVALRPHGEIGAVVRLMTPEHGLQAAYVRGARGRRMRPVLVAGNVVEASLSARTEGQLAQATVELVHSRAPLLGEPLARGGDRLGVRADRDRACPRASLIRGSTTRSTDCSARSRRRRRRAGGGRRWCATNCCCWPSWASGSTSSGARSAASARTWSRSARDRGARSAPREAEPYLGKLLPLPRFVREGGQAGWADILDGLALSGHFLMRDLITDRAAPVAAARERLIERLRRAAGVA